MFKFCVLFTMLISLIQAESPGNKYENSRKLFREAMAGGAVLVQLLESKDLEVVKIDMDLVSTANEKQTLKRMSTDFSYIVTAIGQPSRIEDLDIKVYFVGDGGKLILIAEDNKADNTPVVTFTPPAAGSYMISIKVASMIEGHEGESGFYFLTIAHD